MVTFGSHVGNHQFQPFLSGVYAGVIAISCDHGTYSVTGECTARLNRNCLRGGYRSGTCDCFVCHDSGFIMLLIPNEIEDLLSSCNL